AIVVTGHSSVPGAVRQTSRVRLPELTEVLSPATADRPSPKLSTASKSPATASSASSGEPGDSRVGPAYRRALLGSASLGAVSSVPPWQTTRMNALPVNGTGRSDGSAVTRSTYRTVAVGACRPWNWNTTRSWSA